MKLLTPSFEIITKIEPETILSTIEKAGRMCYKSEGKITDFENTKKFVRGLIKRKHFAMIEHQSITVKFVCDRGVSHEIVRHRIASFAQESTRYCDYSDSGEKGGINMITPFFFTEGKQRAEVSAEVALQMFNVWYEAMLAAEEYYNKLISLGALPEEADQCSLIL